MRLLKDFEIKDLKKRLFLALVPMLLKKDEEDFNKKGNREKRCLYKKRLLELVSYKG